MTRDEFSEEVRRAHTLIQETDESWWEWFEADKDCFDGIISKARVNILRGNVVRATTRLQTCKKELQADRTRRQYVLR